MTQVDTTALTGVLILTPRRFGDARGWFEETWSTQAMAEAGFTRSFVQDNHAMSAHRGTLRGLHFQSPPRAQDKLLRCARGAVLDVAVDIRRGSPTYGRSVAVELSEENGRQLLVPRGFAHGYLTLSGRADVLYKVTDAYAPETEGGLQWNDAALGIDWPIGAEEVVVNARDAAWPALADLQSPFAYGADA